MQVCNTAPTPSPVFDLTGLDRPAVGAQRRTPKIVLRAEGISRNAGVMINRKTPHSRAARAVKNGHHGSPSRLSNAARLRALVSLFDVPIREVAKRSGYSRAYVQRCLSRRDHLVGAARFYLHLENSLADIVQSRRRAFFQIDATDGQRIDYVMRSLRSGS